MEQKLFDIIITDSFVARLFLIGEIIIATLKYFRRTPVFTEALNIAMAVREGVISSATSHKNFADILSWSPDFDSFRVENILYTSVEKTF